MNIFVSVSRYLRSRHLIYTVLVLVNNLSAEDEEKYVNKIAFRSKADHLRRRDMLVPRTRTELG